MRRLLGHAERESHFCRGHTFSTAARPSTPSTNIRHPPSLPPFREMSIKSKASVEIHQISRVGPMGTSG